MLFALERLMFVTLWLKYTFLIIGPKFFIIQLSCQINFGLQSMIVFRLEYTCFRGIFFYLWIAFAIRYNSRLRLRKGGRHYFKKSHGFLIFHYAAWTFFDLPFPNLCLVEQNFDWFYSILYFFYASIIVPKFDRSYLLRKREENTNFETLRTVRHRTKPHVLLISCFCNVIVQVFYSLQRVYIRVI
jgi:hypothetical protein